MVIQKEKLQCLLIESHSYKELLGMLGIEVTKNSLRKIYYYVTKWGLDKSFITNSSHFSIGHRPFNTQPLSQILTEKSPYCGSNNHLKKRLIREGYFERKCYKCGLTKWLGQDIPLQLEHINGVNTDQRIENLTFLCPNCHSLTETFCGRNTERYKRKRARIENVRLEKQRKIALRLEQQQVEATHNIIIQQERVQDKKRMIENRMVYLDQIDVSKWGWVQELSRKWMISHTQVRRFLKKHKPELWEVSMHRTKDFFLM